MTSGPHLKSRAPPGGLTRKRPVAACLHSTTQLEGDPLREQLGAIVSYVCSLLRNARITRYFKTYRRDLPGAFRKICEATAPTAEAAG